jgi:hypothetical protein
MNSVCAVILGFIARGFNLPIASPHLWGPETFLTFAVGDNSALMHDGESLQEIFHL